MLVFAIALIAVLVYYKWNQTAKVTTSKNTMQKPASGPLLVKVLTVDQEEIEQELVLTGTLVAVDEVILAPEVSGKISKLFIQQGKLVNKGQLLLKINDSELTARLKRLETEEQLAEAQERRKQSLLKINSISRDEYEEALNRLQLIRADKNILQTQIEKTEVRAPFTGFLGLKTISEGSYIQQGSPFAQLVDMDPMFIDFTLPEKYSRNLKNGQEIPFYIDGIDKAFKGSVIAWDVKMDPNDRSLKVRAQCHNSEHLLKPGAYARINFPLLHDKKGIMIPSEALIPILKGYKVFLVKNGVAKEQIVETGFRDAQKVLIKEGLNKGDTLILTGMLRLKDGSPLKIEAKPGE